MSQMHVEGQLADNIGYLLISNPKKFNALPQSGWLSVQPAVNKLLASGARVVVVKGDGGNFCAGADISEFDVVRRNAETARVYEASNVEAFAAIRECQVPTIAHIEGYCLGGGFGLAAACDLRLASQEAQFAVPAAKLGLGYPVDAMADIVEAVGAQNAKRLMYAAERFTTAEMKEMGFLLEVLEDSAALGHKVTELAAKIAQLAPLTHKATKTTVRALRSGDFASAKAASDATFDSADYAEGRAAFREKRAPQFSGE
ncbi:MAG: enoyl-CoA hydratase/isomerase family protein [Rhizobiaceae bacterium]|nr:enoyl-CoA hydratase/isomerase family protein [Rhizobiaceae bacterium]